MDPITFLQIELEALKTNPTPDADDYKDAIVEVFADYAHLTDAEIDTLYECFAEYKAQTSAADAGFDALFTRMFCGLLGAQ